MPKLCIATVTKDKVFGAATLKEQIKIAEGYADIIEGFFNEVFKHLEFGDIIPATIKSFFFGFAIGLVGCFKGFTCKKGTAGVGIAANSAVVYTSMLLFIIDFIAVFLTDIFYDL